VGTLSHSKKIIEKKINPLELKQQEFETNKRDLQGPTASEPKNRKGKFKTESLPMQI